MTSGTGPRPAPTTARKWVAHGSSWEEFEDLMIGNREGLLAFREAIDEALNKGSAEVRDCDSEFVGIRVVEVHPEDATAGRRPTWRDRLGMTWALVIMIFLVVCLVYGCVRLPDLFK